MPSLKEDSFTLTQNYLKLIMAEVRLKEMGADAPIKDINCLNFVRMEISMADEAIGNIARRMVNNLPPDPDLDRY